MSEALTKESNDDAWRRYALVGGATYVFAYDDGFLFRMCFIATLIMRPNCLSLLRLSAYDS